VVASVEDPCVSTNARGLDGTIRHWEGIAAAGIESIVIVGGVLAAALHIFSTKEEIWEPSTRSTHLEVLAERPNSEDEVHLDDRHQSDKTNGEDPGKATCESTAMLLQHRRKHSALVLDDQVHQDVSHVKDEADDSVIEIQPHVGLQAVHYSPNCCQDEGQAKKAESRIEGLCGKVDIEPKCWDLENDVARGSGNVEDVLHKVEKQDNLHPERKGASTAELVQWPDHLSVRSHWILL